MLQLVGGFHAFLNIDSVCSAQFPAYVPQGNYRDFESEQICISQW